MTIALVILAALALGGALAALWTRRDSLRRRPAPPASGRRILFPFVAGALSRRALDAGLRLAAAEQATLVPTFLARVSLDLPLDTPIPRQSKVAFAALEKIEQRALQFDVAIDGRIERGRSQRHALRRALQCERFDRIMIAAATRGRHGFDADDIAWLLDHAKCEIIVLRPDENELIANPARDGHGPQGRLRSRRPRAAAKRWAALS